MSVARIAAASACILVAAVAVYAGARDLLAATARSGAAPADWVPAPVDPQVALRTAFASREPVWAHFAAAARHVRMSDALDDASFTLLGQARLLAGDLDGARVAFGYAKQADPRASAPRLGLIETLSRMGDGEAALGETFALLAFRSDMDAAMMPLVMMVAADPAGRALVTEASLRNPVVGARVLAHASGLADQERLVRTLLEKMKVEPAVRDRAISAVAGRGNVTLAHALWTGGQGRVAVFDGNFAGLAAPAPFGWVAARDANATVSIGEEGAGLAAEVSGTLTAALAQQVILLAPGRYHITIAAAQVQGGMFTARLYCTATDQLLAEVEVAERRLGGTQAFVVPAQCPAQRLSLSGRASDPNGNARGRVSRVSIQRVPA